jgi:hypothetical protein
LATSRASVVSSFTIIKGSLIDETYAAFQQWDLARPKADNLDRIRANGAGASASGNWARDVAFTISRRFDPSGRERAVVELAKAGCDREVWKPILLWHMTRDEFLLRDFLVGWLYDRYVDGTYRIRTDDVVPYLQGLKKRRGIQVAGDWSETTTSRVASGLLRIVADFGLLTGTMVKEFTPYHLPEESFLYVLHAMAEAESNARRIVDSADWHMYLMSTADVERELLRLHQFRRLHYEVAGSLAQLDLPCRSSSEYAKELVS